MDGLLILSGIISGLMLLGMLALDFGVDSRDWSADSWGHAEGTGLSI
jgi:hypothetical protein